MGINVSECLSEHEECCGVYTDSIGLGLTLNCCCVCHHYDEKVQGMDKLASQTKPQQLIEPSTQEP